MEDLVSVNTYVRTGNFAESSQNEDILCKNFDNLALPSLIKSYNSDGVSQAGLWTVNGDEPYGFKQTHKLPDLENEESTIIRCSLSSKRGEGQADDFMYKTGQTIGVRAGYKIRQTQTDLTSIYAYDKEQVVLLTLTEETSNFAFTKLYFAASAAFVYAGLAVLMAF